MARLPLIACLAVVALSTAPPCTAQSDDEVEAAIARGLAYVQSRQDPAVGNVPDAWCAKEYKSGETALALLTMLKAGHAPDSIEIERGFTWLLEQPIQRVYEVSVAILALEALYTPEAKASIKKEESLTTQIRRRFKKKASPRARLWLAGAVKFLVEHQDPSGLWRYPFFGEPDLSNAQFAILALKAAQRMGVRVSPEVYLKTATGLLEFQEKNGPDVASFPVRAADRPIKGLLDKRERRRARRKKKRTKGDRRGTRTRDPAELEQPTTTTTGMKARGWGYKRGQGARGSMTAAGLAMLVVCKSELEGHGGYDSQMGPLVDQALRDGAAWIASRFRVDANPGAEPDWLFYYLYTLERAGTLLAINTFGARDWYREGARFLIDHQQADGRFQADTSGERDGDLVGTCLAILFLKRSTIPVLKRPKTGGDKQYGQLSAGGAKPDAPEVKKQSDGTLQVTLRYRANPGQRVMVAGSFNGWSTDANPLTDPDGDGVFELTLPLPAGRHQYKFVVDGQWRHDPANPSTEADGHGGQNSVIAG